MIEEVTLSDGTVILVDGQNQPTLDIRAGIENEASLANSADINVGTLFFGTFLTPQLGNVLCGYLAITSSFFFYFLF